MLTALAGQFAAAFESFTRDATGPEKHFYRLKDGSPAWMTEVCHAAHGDMMPDDYRYEMIQDAALAIAEADEGDDLDERGHEFADSVPSVYHSARAAWLASHLTRFSYCDEAAEELDIDKMDMSDRIAAGWYREAEEVYGLVLQGLREQDGEEE